MADDKDVDMTETQNEDDWGGDDGAIETNETGDWGDENAEEDWRGADVVPTDTVINHNDGGDIDEPLTRSQSIIGLSKNEIDEAIHKKVQQLKDQIELDGMFCVCKHKNFLCSSFFQFAIFNKKKTLLYTFSKQD
ncbi:hypothetical protein RFI_24103, partial [Reticulomyxa filosa]